MVASADNTTARVCCLQIGHEPDESRSVRFTRVLELLRTEVPSADLVVLPELWWTGYFNFDAYRHDARPLDDEMFTALAEVAAAGSAYVVAGTFVEQHDGGRSNTAVVFGPDGATIHTYRKAHLFGYGSRESDLLVAGHEAGVVSTDLGGLAVTTCYDLRFPELYRLLVDGGAELIVIPAAWPMARREHWQLLLRARAVENQAVVIGTNGAGRQGDVELAGASVIVSPSGEVLAEAGAGQEKISATVNLADITATRHEFPVLEHRRIDIGPLR